MLEYLPAIIVAIVAVIIMAIAYIACRNGYQNYVFKILYALVVKAENEIEGTQKGKEKKAQVVSKIHDILPFWAKLFINESDIDTMLERAVVVMKEALKKQIDKDAGIE